LYDPTTIGSNIYPHSHDISIVKLNDVLTFNLRVGQACLPEKSFNPPILGYVSGFGVTEKIQNPDNTIENIKPRKLQFLDIPIMSNKKCKAVMRFPWTISLSMLCAGPPLGYEGESTCDGDSGKM
jgi:hypothetical protein